MAEATDQRLMSAIEVGILGLYFLTLVILAVLGTHRYLMIYLYHRDRDQKALPAPLPEDLPRVTVQLPIYNEMYVVERLLESVVGIRYPKDRLEIQVLDDSTDETQGIARRAVEAYREQGFDIHYLHRADRTGFKAGALAAGLAAAKGELVLIFDADFVAPPDVLEKTVGQFSDPQVGVVQTRWGHINRDYSLLTQVQSVMLDGHFILEHGGRNRSGRFFNFNGTAGLWRRAAIEDAGGWQHDTLTEDLDLSFRAQMKGWRFVYLEDVVCPAELPVEMNSFKSQQHRWAKGSVQTCLKLLPRVLASPLPLHIKVESIFHLTANFAYPLMLLLSVLMFPAMVIRYNMGLYEMLIVDVPLFMGATLSVCSFYLKSQKVIFGRRLEEPAQVPARGAVRGHRHLGEQRQGGAGGPARHPVGLQAHPQVPRGRRLRRVEDQALQGRPRTSCPSWSWPSRCTSASWPGTRSPTTSGAPCPSS